jgi:ketosteroid isomerase-like protein
MLEEENNKTWEPSAVSISKSGDLGYTYGYSKIKNMGNDNTGVYLRVWRRVENNWKLVADIEAQKSK